MKNVIFIVFLIPVFVLAQEQNKSSWNTEIGVNALFKSSMHFIEGRLSINDGTLYTIRVAKELPFRRSVALSYSYMPTDLSFNPTPLYLDAYQNVNEKMNIHFIKIIGRQYLTVNQQIQPFFEAGAGVAVYDIVQRNIDGRTHFLMDIGAGIKVPFFPNWSIIINGNATMPLYGRGTGLYCGIGSGYGPNCGLSFNTSAFMIHWTLGGEICYNF